MGAMLKFPAPKEDPGKALAVKARPLPILQKFQFDAARDLLFVCQAVIEGSQELINFIDHNREAAKQAGVETIGIELSSILEGGGLERILDSLEHSVLKERSSEVTIEGLARLRRAESLLAEANANITKYTGYWRGKPFEARMSGSGQESSGSNDVLMWLPFLALGAIAIVVVVFASGSDNKK